LNRLQRAAIAAFCIHFVAGAAMALILRHGLETNPDLQTRLGFLVNHRALWTFGWLTWTAAAFAILYFYVIFAAAHSESDQSGASRSTLHFAVLLTTAALAPDLAAQAIEIGVLPDLAQHTDFQRFVLLHRIAVMMSGYVANGLYSLSAWILTWSTRSAYRTWVWFAGMAVGAFGLVLSVAALMNSIEGMFWSNVLLLPSILLWLAGVAAEAKVSGKDRTNERNSGGSH
jgi:hypothetical protein